MARPSARTIIKESLARFTENSPELLKMGLRAKLAELFMAALAAVKDDSLTVTKLREIAAAAGIDKQVEGYINKLVKGRWLDEVDKDSWIVSSKAIKRLSEALRGEAADKPKPGKKNKRGGKKNKKSRGKRGKKRGPRVEKSDAGTDRKFLEQLDKLSVSGLLNLGESLKSEVVERNKKLGIIRDYAKGALAKLQ